MEYVHDAMTWYCAVTLLIARSVGVALSILMASGICSVLVHQLNLFLLLKHRNRRNIPLASMTVVKAARLKLNKYTCDI